jgi:hypothetical protein
MANLQSSWRTNDQLLATLDDSGNWVVNGQGGQILGVGASLRRAIDRAEAFAMSGAVVLALRRRDPDIAVFPSQMQELERLIAGREFQSRVMDAEPTRVDLTAFVA